MRNCCRHYRRAMGGNESNVGRRRSWMASSKPRRIDFRIGAFPMQSHDFALIVDKVLLYQSDKSA